MKAKLHIVLVALAAAAVVGAALCWIISFLQSTSSAVPGRVELIVTNLTGSPTRLFRAGKALDASTEMTEFTGGRIRLAEGSYYLNVEHADTAVLYPIPIISSLPGPDADGMFNITIRPLPARPPRLLPSLPEFGYIPSGHFLFGDRLNPLEPQYVWLTGYFISPFEVTNAEYREFSRDPNGYGDDDNWTEAGRKWKAKSSSHVRFQDRRTAFALNPWLLNRIERHRHSFISYS